MDGLISIAEGNLQVLLAQRQRLEKERADLEQAGVAVEAGVLAHIERLGSDHAALQQQLDRNRELRAQAQADFARDRSRIAELLNLAR